MRARTTFILFLLVIGLAVFVYTYERHQRSTLERRIAGSLTGYDPAIIDSIELKNGSLTAKLKRKAENRWFLTDPIDDRVDPAFVVRLLGLAEKAEISETIPDDQIKDSDRTRFGLDDKSAIQITWRSEGKTIGRLKVGKIGALGETAYAEAPGNKEYGDVYLFWAKPDTKTVNVREELNRSLEDMRDTSLLPYKSQEITSFSIRHPGKTGEIEVERTILSDKEATPWVLTKPLKTRGEQKQIDNFVGLFANAKANKLLPPTPAPANLPANPVAEIQFQKDPAAKGATIRFYPPDPPDSKYLTGYLTDRKTWFTIESEFLQAIPESPNDLRARTLADLEAKKITTILINNLNGDNIELYRIDGRWFIKKGDEQFLAASGDRVSKTLQALNQAEIGSFANDSLTKPADYGLDQPFQTITFGTAEHVRGKGLGALTPQNSLVLQFGQNQETHRLYANFKGETSVYEMLPEHFNLVPNRELKWRNLQILEFGRQAVRRLQQTLGTEPPVTLKAKTEYGWSASRVGSDVDPTAFLNKEAVERILNRLGTLNVDDWATGLQDGHKALQTPSLELEIDVEYVTDRSALDKPSLKTIQLTFAPIGDPKTALYYYGRCTDYADYFLISREVYKELSTPLLKN